VRAERDGVVEQVAADRLGSAALDDVSHAEVHRLEAQVQRDGEHVACLLLHDPEVIVLDVRVWVDRVLLLQLEGHPCSVPVAALPELCDGQILAALAGDQSEQQAVGDPLATG